MGLLNQKCITDFSLQEGEVLREIPGFPDYKVSNLGRVFSHRGKIEKMLRPSKSWYGYEQVTLSNGEKKRTMVVHRLVALAFIPNPENKPCVDHINTMKTDNRPENLRWVSHKENSANPLTVEHMDEARPLIKEKCSHPVYVYDEDLNELSAFTSTKDAAKDLNLSQGNISSCCMGSLPRYRGLIWSYARLSSMDERKALEDSVKEKFNKNRASTRIATQQWQQRNREKYIKRVKDYYYEHKEEILEKRRKKYGKKEDRKETND